jgi:predicted glycosyltransferase
MPSFRRVLFHPTNGIGIGHISRLAAIALALRINYPGTQVLFALEKSSPVLLESLTLPYVSVPDGNGEPADSSLAPFSSVPRLKSAMVECIFREFFPDIVVFDGSPDRSFIEGALQHGRHIAVCLREVKDLESLHSLAPAIHAARLIIVPSEPGEWVLPPGLTHKAAFVGQISRPYCVRETAKKYWVNDPYVVISGGGGGYPGTFEFYNLALRAFGLCEREMPQLKGVLVTGPLFREWSSLAPLGNVKVVPFEENMLSLFARANLAIVQGGYNTIAELAQLQIPTICLPAERQHDDQHKRAMRFCEQMPSFRVRVFGVSDIEIVASEMQTLLNLSRPDVPIHKDSLGASRAADALMRSLR